MYLDWYTAFLTHEDCALQYHLKLKVTVVLVSIF